MRLAYLAIAGVLAAGPTAADAQVPDSLPPESTRRMELRSQRMVERMAQREARMQRGQLRMERGQMRSARGLGRGVMGRGGFSPSALLMQRQSLGLTEDQVAQLETLRDQRRLADSTSLETARGLLTDEQRGRVMGHMDARGFRGQARGDRMRRPRDRMRGRQVRPQMRPRQLPPRSRRPCCDI